MHTTFLAGLVVMIATAAINAQTPETVPPTQSSQTAATPPKALTLVGCVQPDETKPDRFTFWAKDTGKTYRLSGASMKGFEWRNVRIVGGLVPTVNLAAQAGAIDETRVAMAQQGSDPQGSRNLEIFEFRVSTVRALSGTCTRKP